MMITNKVIWTIFLVLGKFSTEQGVRAGNNNPKFFELRKIKSVQKDIKKFLNSIL